MKQKIFIFTLAVFCIISSIYPVFAVAAPNTNLLKNPSLETVVDVGNGKKFFEYWSTWYGLEDAKYPFKYEISNDAHNGSKSIKLYQYQEFATQAVYQIFDKNSNINHNANFTFTVWVKYVNISGQGFNIGIQKRNSVTNRTADIMSKNYTGSSNGWVKLTITTYDSAFDADTIVPIVNVNPGAGNGYVLIDDMTLTGSTAPVPGNYMKDASFEGSKTDGKLLNDCAELNLWPGLSKPSQKVSFDTAVKHSGAQSYKITQSNEVQAIYYLFNKDKNPKLFDMDKWQFSAWLKLNDVTTDPSLPEEAVFVIVEVKYTTGNTKVFYTSAGKGTADWKNYAVEFSKSDFSGSTPSEFVLKVQIPTGTGSVNIDDLYFGKPGSDGTPKPITLVDVLKKTDTTTKSDSTTTVSQKTSSSPTGQTSDNETTIQTSLNEPSGSTSDGSAAESTESSSTDGTKTSGGVSNGGGSYWIYIIAAVVIALGVGGYFLYKFLNKKKASQ